MYILDTNHVDVLKYDGPRRDLLRARLLPVTDQVFTTIVTVQENVQGWFSKINDQSTPVADLVHYYKMLEGLVTFYSAWNILQFDERAAQEYSRLLQLRLRGPGPNDLRIAAIALCHNATVLTADTNHFGRINGLRSEDWLLDPPVEEAPI